MASPRKPSHRQEKRKSSRQRPWHPAPSLTLLPLPTNLTLPLPSGKNWRLLLFWYYCASVHTKPVQSCPTLCDPMDYRLPGSSVHWTFQARILSGLRRPPLRDLLDPGIKPASPAFAGPFFSTSIIWEASLVLPFSPKYGGNPYLQEQKEAKKNKWTQQPPFKMIIWILVNLLPIIFCC